MINKNVSVAFLVRLCVFVLLTDSVNKDTELDYRSCVPGLSRDVKKTWSDSGAYGLCDAGTALYQLTYSVSLELVLLLYGRPSQ